MSDSELNLMADGGGFSSEDEPAVTEKETIYVVEGLQKELMTENLYMISEEESNQKSNCDISLDDISVEECFSADEREISLNDQSENESIEVNLEKCKEKLSKYLGYEVELSIEEESSEESDKSEWIFGSDGVVGHLRIPGVKSIVTTKGKLSDVIRKMKENKHISLSGVVIISAGNEDISQNKFSLSKFKHTVRTFETYIQKKNGKLALTSLIPRPKDQDPVWAKEYGKKYREQRSKRYAEVNEFIYKFNLKNGRRTPMLKQYVESSKENPIDKRMQRKIKLSCFTTDGIHLKDSTKKSMEKVLGFKFKEYK